MIIPIICDGKANKHVYAMKSFLMQPVVVIDFWCYAELFFIPFYAGFPAYQSWKICSTLISKSATKIML